MRPSSDRTAVAVVEAAVALVAEDALGVEVLPVSPTACAGPGTPGWVASASCAWS